MGRDLGNGFAGYASYTWLSAEFAAAATTGVAAAAGSLGRAPARVPMASAYGEFPWSYPRGSGFIAGLEILYAGRCT